MLKYVGGLGIWRMKKACLMKLDWSLRNGGNVVPVHLQDMMVKDLVDLSGLWNLPMLDSRMPQHVSDILLAMLPPSHGVW
jgi:hypothetical protein